MKKYIYITGALILVIVVGVVVTRGSSARAKEEVIIVKSGTVKEEVTETGKVMAANAVELGFERSGKVLISKKNVGDTVQPNDIIAQLDTTEVTTNVAEAKATLQLEQAKLTELQVIPQSGAQVALASSTVEYESARLNLIKTLQAAYVSAEDGIHNKVDEFFIEPRSSQPSIKFKTAHYQQEIIESGRVEVEERLEALTFVMPTLSVNKNIVAESARIKTDLAEIKLFLDTTALALNSAEVSTGYSIAMLNEWKAHLVEARASIDEAINLVMAAELKYTNAEAALLVAEKRVTDEAKGTQAQQIRAQRARVAQAEAQLANANAQLAKSYIRSPISGIVTKQQARVGEIVTANTPLVSVISDAQFEIEIMVPEQDLSKVKVGQVADVVLDAYGPGVTLEALVVRIDAIETVVDDESLYKTILQLSTSDEIIRPGLTAHVTIRGEVRENVLSVPERAVITRNSEEMVMIKLGQRDAQEVTVKTGLRGSNGFIEIISGLQEGDQVVVSLPK